MADEKIHENVSPKVRENVRREAREAGKQAGEAVVKKLVDRGFRDADVRPSVVDGLVDAYHDVVNGKTKP